jgi:hypothetical protein
MDETDVLRILPALLSVTPARIVLDINIEARSNQVPLRIAAAAMASGLHVFQATAVASRTSTARMPGDLVAAAKSLGFMLLDVTAVARPAPAPTPSPTPAPTPAPAPTPVQTPTMGVTLPGTWAYAAGDDFTSEKDLYNLGMKPGDFWGAGRDSSDPNGTIITHTIEDGRLKMWPVIGSFNGVENGLVSRHLTTYGKWETPTDKRYFLQVRAKLAPGNGRWPSIWLRGDNFSAISSQPEIDLMESGAGQDYGANGVPYAGTMNAWRDTGTVNGVAQGQTNNGAYIRFESQTLTTSFHTWAVDCNPATGVVTCYFDGAKIGELGGMGPTIGRPMYLVLSENFRTAGMTTGPYNIGALGDVQTLRAANQAFEVDEWHCWTQPVMTPPPPPSDAISDPVTEAMAGTRTFNVTSDSELDAVPFSSLAAGDVVNIHYKATPYKRIIRVRNSGTQAAPIRIRGVTNALGQRPVFSGDGASVAEGAKACFLPHTYANSWADREAIGLIATAIAPGDNYLDRPKYVVIEHIEVQDVRAGLPYTDALGNPHTWREASGVRVQDGADIVVQNCVIHDCDFGAFSQVNNIDAAHAALRPVLRNCRIYNCGMEGRSTEHGAYWQGISPIVEGNFFGPVRAGALGSSFKSRSSDLIFRFNWVEASSRALDIVHSEDSWTGV